ncbi:MAG: carbamoyl phosphate synthase small subunit [Planctomycetaceae bacterium]|jgi:carbamoyl-phosphate synthase small subunit|nr:carbamoyl phosphate synthase small subunit [Planctomycetaceae bacterium]
MKNQRGMLALEDGRCFYGISFGYEGATTGEVVFNTSMTGYQEVISDMSYAGQIVAMTAPQIGNTGFNTEDYESQTPRICGFLTREFSSVYSNWRACESLGEFFKRSGIVAISGIDTRALTIHLRTHGLLRAAIAVGDWNTAELVQKAKNSPRLEDLDLVGQLTTEKPFEWKQYCNWILDLYRNTNDSFKGRNKLKRIVVYDFGVKQNILRSLLSMISVGEDWNNNFKNNCNNKDGGNYNNDIYNNDKNNCKVIVVPSSTTAEEALKLQPDGVVLSNGPGDPARLNFIVDEIKKLVGKVPLFGICLGHQLIARTFGAKTYKMKFGHRGSNQPVLNKRTGKVEITSQNHSFCVDPDSLPKEMSVSHVNLNDGTVEGMIHAELPIFSVQYHPESAAGPHDATYLFEQFIFGNHNDRT